MIRYDIIINKQDSFSVIMRETKQPVTLDLFTKDYIV